MTFEPKCILYAEDDEASVYLLREAFGQAGIDCALHAVNNGQLALSYLAGEGDFSDRVAHPFPCLVLLDLKLPGLDGLKVLERIRGDPMLKRLVVIVLSSSTLEEDVRAASELGANSYVEKPMRFEDTVEMVRLLKGWWLDHHQFAPIESRSNVHVDHAS